jgi:hypothetical protein
MEDTFPSIIPISPPLLLRLANEKSTGGWKEAELFVRQNMGSQKRGAAAGRGMSPYVAGKCAIAEGEGERSNQNWQWRGLYG